MITQTQCKWRHDTLVKTVQRRLTCPLRNHCDIARKKDIEIITIIIIIIIRILRKDSKPGFKGSCWTAEGEEMTQRTFGHWLWLAPLV